MKKMKSRYSVCEQCGATTGNMHMHLKSCTVPVVKMKEQKLLEAPLEFSIVREPVFEETLELMIQSTELKIQSLQNLIAALKLQKGF